MTNESLKIQMADWLPEITFEDGTGWLTASLPTASWKPIARQLRSHAVTEFDFLFCVTGVDWKTHLSVVYHLRSTVHHHTLIVKLSLDRMDPQVETVSDIWQTAEFHEREVYDLFGVRFINHPDLRRLFLTDDYQGWPLRKDFEDPVNMIKL